MIDTHNHLHDGFISKWARKNPQEVLRFRKSFNVTGRTFADLTKGIELVLKEQMASAPPEQWATISLPGRGPSGLGSALKVIYSRSFTAEPFKPATLYPKMLAYVMHLGLFAVVLLFVPHILFFKEVLQHTSHKNIIIND